MKHKIPFSLIVFIVPWLLDAGVPLSHTSKEPIAAWKAQYERLQQKIAHRRNGLGKSATVSSKNVHSRHALIWESDRDPLDVIVRRTRALIGDLESKHSGIDLSDYKKRLKQIHSASCSSSGLAKSSSSSGSHRQSLYLEAAALRRQVAFSNPVLDFSDILVVVRYEGQGHMCFDPLGYRQKEGGGIFIIKNAFSSNKQIVNVLANSTVQKGRLKGLKLEGGSFMSPDLSYDGSRILFAYTDKGQHKDLWDEDTLMIPKNSREWTSDLVKHDWKWHLFHPKDAFHIYKVGIDGSGLTELTYAPHDDFDPCWLPNGRIAFISTRRGGFGRCHSSPKPTFTLYSMKDDGSDVFCISFHETNEWQPSVDNEGMIVYTRWDYVDRGSDHAHHLWRCAPDGRDPRAPHGNYPHFYFDCKVDGYESPVSDGRHARPWFEGNFRAVPGVNGKYIAVAAAHHGPTDLGTVILIDITGPDDGMLSQLTRITPEVAFPEAEGPKKGACDYGTPWPLSEDYYLVNYWSDLYLLDKFGNKELICKLSEVNYSDPDNRGAATSGSWRGFRIMDPIPIKQHQPPPSIATQTWQGERMGSNDHKRATLAIQNVYEADPWVVWPEDREIKWMRIIEIFPKTTYGSNDPNTGNHQGICRMSLGVVPVEEDGSVYCEAPVEKPIYFQLLDENMMAVQSMRSATYVHPGEQLSCMGCHEYKWKSIPPRPGADALGRKPSKLKPEYGVVEPLSYYRTVKPVFERTCKPCHQKIGSPLTDFSWDNLKRDYRWPQSAGGNHKGSSRSYPNCLGAYKCKMGQTLINARHKAARADGTISDEDYNRVVSWLDAAGYLLGAYIEVGKQEAGELVWPLLDVDPNNPQGIERNRPLTEGGRVRGKDMNKRAENIAFSISVKQGLFLLHFARKGAVTIDIFSLSGKLLYSRKKSEDKTDFFLKLDRLALPEGMVLVRVSRGREQCLTKAVAFSR